MLPATLLLLSGGQSRRMGSPKALLPVGGTTLLAWLIERLGVSFPEVLVSANDGLLVPDGVRMIRDRRPGGLGPLAGVEAGLAAAGNDALVVVACDMPRVTVELLETLIGLSEGHDAAVPRLGGRPEPACACYRRSAAWTIGAALDRGRLKAASALDELDIAWLDDVDRKLFWNMNAPKDYQLFLSAR